MSSVNADVDSDQFPTAWGTFDDVSALLLSLPPGCEAATFDVSAAYRITPVRPEQQNALCVSWRDRVYVDRALCFGLASSAGVFGSIADMLVALYGAYGFGPILKWVDDFFVIRLPTNHFTEADFLALTSPAGVPWSLSKLRPFATLQRFTGFDWDLFALTVSLPQEKLDSITALLHQWLKDDHRASQRDAQSLHGKLVHIHQEKPKLRISSNLSVTRHYPVLRHIMSTNTI